MKFLQQTPFFRLLLPLIAGIVTYRFFELAIWGLVVLALVGFLLMFLSFALKKSHMIFTYQWVFGLGITVFLFATAYYISYRYEQNNRFAFGPDESVYRVRLAAAPVAKEKTFKCVVDVISDADKHLVAKTHSKAILYIARSNESNTLMYGDYLLVKAKFNPPPGVVNPCGFDYRAYLHRQAIHATAYVSSSSWRRIGFDDSFSILRYANKWRTQLLQIYHESGIRGDEFAVLAALTLGYADDIQPDLLSGYSATGAMHILSVSGMHVGIVFAFFAFLLRFMDKNRRTKVLKGVVIILCLWLYAFLSGMSAAVIRSAIMFSFVGLADCFGRKSNIYNTLFASAFLMLLFNPNYLFDVGFQLSYAAVLSIVFFQPVFFRYFQPRTRASRWLWTMFTVSVAAQLGTIPFTLYYFHQFPLYFLITNLIAIPLSAAIIYLAMVLMALSWVPGLASALGWVISQLLWLMNNSVLFIRHLPFSVGYISIDLLQSILLFVVLVCLSVFYNRRKFAWLATGMLVLLVVVSIDLYHKYTSLHSQTMLVYSGQKCTHVSFISGCENKIYTGSMAELSRLAQAYWVVRKVNSNQDITKETNEMNGFYAFNKKKILILTSNFLTNKYTPTPLNIDYLIVGGGIKPYPDDVFACVQPREVIVDNTISRWYTTQLHDYCVRHAIVFHAIREEGAYVLNMKD